MGFLWQIKRHCLHWHRIKRSPGSVTACSLSFLQNWIMKTISTYPKKKLARSLGYDPKMYIGQSRSCYKRVSFLVMSGVTDSTTTTAGKAMCASLSLSKTVVRLRGEGKALWELPWNRLQKPLACPAKSLKTLGGVLNPVSFSRQFPKSLFKSTFSNAWITPVTVIIDAGGDRGALKLTDN